jgi:drug/metabolite transporter (DMT)-like permease
MTDSTAPRAGKSALPYIALGLGILGLGMSAILVRWAGAPGAVSGLYRVGIAAVVMALPAAAKLRREAPLQRRYVLLAVLAGLFFVGDLATWNTALFFTSATNATLFGNTAPVWVGLVALWIFREKLGRAFWLGLGLAMLGAVVILSADFLKHPTLGFGDLLSLSTGMFYAGFFLFTQRAREGLSSLSAWWISAVASTLGLLVVSVLLGQPLTGYAPATYLNLLALALVTQVGGYLAINYALGHLPASIVAPTMLGQVVLTALLAIPLLGEAITSSQVLGGALVLGGIWLIHQRRAAAPVAADVSPA